MRLRRHGHVLEDLFLVPDVVTSGDYLGAEVEEFIGDRGGNPEATCGVLPIDYQQVDRVRFHHMRQMFANDMPACRAKDIADKENIHPPNPSMARAVFDEAQMPCGGAR